MAEQYRFFDHIDGDRLYNADEFAEYFRQVLTSGVLNGGTNLQVYCNGADRIARIKAGKAWLEGYFYKLTEELELQLDEAHGTYDRIDRIVLRLDRNPQNRFIKAFVKTGVPAMNPSAPALTREGLIYEISLAQILVVHNTTVIPSNKVTDERLDASVCGLVNSLIQVDTATMQAEFDAFMAYLQSQGYVPQADFLSHLNASDPHNQYAFDTDLANHINQGAATNTAGHIKLATSAEVTAGTDATKAVTPAGNKVELDKKIDKSLATAANDFLVASAASTWVKKTLAEVRTLLGCLLTTGGTMSGEVNHADNLVTRAFLKDYAEAVTANATASGTVTLNIETANNFNLTISGATTLVFSNPSVSGRACSITVIIRMPATLYAITFPASVKWDGDKIPTFNASRTAILTFVTIDGGARWYGMPAGTKFTT